jgi:hypothetical protein
MRNATITVLAVLVGMGLLGIFLIWRLIATAKAQ